MADFITILTGLTPSFLLIALGGLVRGRLSAKAWLGLDRLNFEILFPTLIFVAASSRPIEASDLLTVGPAVWAIMLCGLLLGRTSRSFGPSSFLDFAGAWQTAWRFNTAIAFVAVGVAQRADAAVMAITIGMAVPVANIFAVSALSRGGNLGKLATLGKVLRNPFLIASVAGILVGVSGQNVPVVLMAPLEMLAEAAIPIALLSIGATMNWTALAKLDAFSAILNATKLVALPAIVLIFAKVFGFDGPLVATLVVFAALPTASAAHVLASAFGADRERVATIIAQSTLLSGITLPIWIFLS
ncbi:MAG: AEC family transporter [Rhodobacteraceae bacterium]|nr:AEC family transporter [Paracoccaceae bacterium]